MIETKGLVALFEANRRNAEIRKLTSPVAVGRSGLVTAFVEGDVAAVKPQPMPALKLHRASARCQRSGDLAPPRRVAVLRAAERRPQSRK